MASRAASVSSSSEEWRQLLQQTLGKVEGSAVAASLARREVVINVTSSEKDQASLARREVVINVTSSKKPDLGTRNSGAPSEGHGDVETGITHGAHTNSAVPVVFTEEPASVLHIVAAAGDGEGYLECARMIYKKASHLLTTAAANSNDDTPLHCAARIGNTKMVACLIELAKGVNGVDDDKARDLVRMRNKRGETALHEAVRFDNMQMVQDLMSTDKELAQIDAEDGTSPLYLACSLGHDRSVRLILDEGKEPSCSGPRGQNALHAAALQDGKVTTELLLKWRKDFAKQIDMDGNTPLHYAASAPDPFFRFTLNVFSASNFQLCSLGSVFAYAVPLALLRILIEGGKPPVLYQLLDADPTSVFQPDNQGSFPVHVAAAADCTVSLMILLTRYTGCAGLRNADGQTFLHVAVEKKRISVVRFALYFMVGSRRRALARSVLNVQDKKGNTALHLACTAGELYMCRLLVRDKCTNINLRNMNGRTPMDIAAGRVQSGFYFGLGAHRRILSILRFANALSGANRRDQMEEYHPRLNEEAESNKIKDFAQIVGIGSVLVSTATFAAVLTVPGGLWTPGDSGGKRLVAPPPAVAGTPVLIGSYAFDAFIISNTLAFICSTLATFSLIYCGVAAVDIRKRFQMVSFSLVLLLCAARSFCAAFAFALYLMLAKVAHGTAVASCALTSFAVLDGFMFLCSSLNDMLPIIIRRGFKDGFKGAWRFGPFLFFNVLYPFWPYLIIGGYMAYDFLSTEGKFHVPSRRH